MTSWWATFRAADDTALAAWTIRSHVRSLAAYPPGESPLEIRYIEMSTAAGYYDRSTRASVKFEVKETKAEPNVQSFVLMAICKLGDRYIGSTARLGVDDKQLRPGRKQTFDRDPFLYLSWPHKRLFDHCELRVMGLDAQRLGNDRLVDEHCWVDGRIDPGPCAGFRRTPTAEPFIREVVGELHLHFPIRRCTSYWCSSR